VVPFAGLVLIAIRNHWSRSRRRSSQSLTVRSSSDCAFNSRVCRFRVSRLLNTPSCLRSASPFGQLFFVCFHAVPPGSRASAWSHQVSTERRNNSAWIFSIGRVLIRFICSWCRAGDNIEPGTGRSDGLTLRDRGMNRFCWWRAGRATLRGKLATYTGNEAVCAPGTKVTPRLFSAAIFWNCPKSCTGISFSRASATRCQKVEPDLRAGYSRFSFD